jgi:hypothetical protein
MSNWNHHSNICLDQLLLPELPIQQYNSIYEINQSLFNPEQLKNHLTTSPVMASKEKHYYGVYFGIGVIGFILMIYLNQHMQKKKTQNKIIATP